MPLKNTNQIAETKKLIECEGVSLNGPVISFVVYLDDEKDLLDSIELVANDFGLKSFVTSSPDEALSFIKSHQYEIAYVLSDYKMPALTGFDFREQVTKVAPNIPFAILSGYIDKDMALKAVDLKVSAFVEKPINDEKFSNLFKKDGILRIRSLKEDAELLVGFIEEASAKLEQAEELALQFEKNPHDLETVNQCFGIVHTVKGTSGFFEPKTLSRFAHRFEEVLKQLQRKELALTEEVVSSILRGLDYLKLFLDEFKTRKHNDHDIDSLIIDLFSFEKTKKVSQLEAADETDTKPKKQEDHSVQSKTVPAELKVAVRLLDEFMQISGEMTVIRNMLNKCVRSIEHRYYGDKDVVMLAELFEELHKINGNVQTKITELRKVPIRNILKPIPRTIRDVSKTLHKEIDFITHGDDLMVDTAIAEVLNSSLIHIVRNSLDHGIETPNERVSIGKEAKGKLQISSSIKNDTVIIEIEDDGKGLNEESIKNKLVKNGSHTYEQASKLSKPELYGMIFEAGFSTAATVTDISGRGVGMSMVKTSVVSVGGHIEILSYPGMGAKFRLILPEPKSVLITNCLFLKCNGMQFGIPQDDVLRILQFERSGKNIFEIEGGKTLRIDQQLIPIVRLEMLLELDSSYLPNLQNDNHSKNDLSTSQLIVLSSATRKLAIEVDQVLDIEDTVIKKVQGPVGMIDVFKGATFLGDGSIGLILETEGLLSKAGINKLTPQVAEHSTDQQKNDTVDKPSNILLFKLNETDLYSIPQSSVLRIEEFNKDKIYNSGNYKVIPYRDRVLTIIDTEALLYSFQENLDRFFGSKLTTVVISYGNQYLGLVVREISDIVEITGDPIGGAQKFFGIAGTYILTENCVTALNLSELIAKLKDQGKIENILSEHDKTDGQTDGALAEAA